MCYIRLKKKREEKLFSGYSSFAPLDLLLHLLLCSGSLALREVHPWLSSSLVPECIQPMGSRGNKLEGRRKEWSLSAGHGITVAKVLYSRSQLCRYSSSKVTSFSGF